MADKRPAGEAQLEAKKKKFDENDIDYMISDLRKEEAQLVITRVLKQKPEIENEVRSCIELVRHSRNQLSAEQIMQQVQQLQQLFALQSQATVGNFSFGNLSGGEGGDASQPMPSESRLRTVKNAIRDSFRKKSGYNSTHAVDEESANSQVAKATDMILKGNAKGGIMILEAITEEYINKGTQLGEDNIVGFKSFFNDLAKAWLDAMLSEPLEFTNMEREEWEDKLRSWDKSAHGSTMEPARYAARNGWTDEALVAVLSGEPTEDYKEPVGLTTARLDILEREKKFEKAMNLARHSGLHEYAARFMIKEGKIDEAVECAKQVLEPARVFTIAQAARSINIESTFVLGIRSLVVDDEGYDFKDRVSWLVNLAVSENKVSALISETLTSVARKDIQFAMIKVISEQKHLDKALDMARTVIQPYSISQLEQYHSAYLERKTKRQELAGSVVTNFAELKPENPTLSYYLDQLPGCAVPYDLSYYIWNTSHEAAKVEATDAAEALVDLALNINIEYCTVYENMSQLLKQLQREGESESVTRLGSRILDVVEQQSATDKSYRDENIREAFKFEKNKRNQELGLRFQPRAIEHPVYDFQASMMAVCRIMIDTQLTKKNYFIEQKRLFDQKRVFDEQQSLLHESERTNFDSSLPSLTSEEIENGLLQCHDNTRAITKLFLNRILDPDILMKFVKDLMSQEEFRLSLLICDSVCEILKDLNEKRMEREKWQKELSELRNELDILQQQRLTLSPEKATRLSDLTLIERLDSLNPQFTRTESSFRSKLEQVSLKMLTSALDSKKALLYAERMAQEDVKKVVTKVLEMVECPNYLISLMKCNTVPQECEISLMIMDQCISLSQKLHSEYKEDRAIIVELSVIEQQRNILQQQFKEELSGTLQARFVELTEQKAQLNPSFYCQVDDSSFSDTIKGYEFKSRRVGLQACINDIARLQALLDNQEIEAEEKAKFEKEMVQANKTYQKIFDSSLHTIDDPSQLINFCDLDINAAEVCQFSERCFELCLSFEEQRASRVDTFEDRDDLVELQKDKLFGKQNLEEKDLLKLYELNNQIEKWNLEASYTRLTANDYHRSLRDAALKGVKSILDRQTSFARRRNALLRVIQEPQIGYVSDSAAAAVAAAAAKSAAEKEIAEIAEEQKQLTNQLHGFTQKILSVTTGPRSLYDIAKVVCDSISNMKVVDRVVVHEKVDDEDLMNIIISLSKLGFEIIANLDDARVSRLPTHELIELIDEEEATLQNVGKALSDEKLKQLNQAKRERRIQNKMASFNNRTADEYLKYSYEFGYLLVNTFSDHLGSMESSLRTACAEKGDVNTIYNEDIITKIKNRHTVLSEKLLEVIDLVVDVVGSPQLIDYGAKLINCEVFIDAMIKVTNQCLAISKDRAEEFDERAPWIEEYNTLSTQKQELIDIMKNITAEEEERYQELRHLNFIFSNQNYTYHQDWSEYDLEIKNAIISSLTHFNSVKVQLNNELFQIENSMNDENAMEVDTLAVYRSSEEIEKLISKIDTHISSIIDDALDHCKNPDHCIEICKYLSKIMTGYDANDFVMKSCEKALNYASELEGLRLDRAVKERTYYLLQCGQQGIAPEAIKQETQSSSSRRTGGRRNDNGGFGGFGNGGFGFGMEQSFAPAIVRQAGLTKPQLKKLGELESSLKSEAALRYSCSGSTMSSSNGYYEQVESTIVDGSKPYVNRAHLSQMQKISNIMITTVTGELAHFEQLLKDANDDGKSKKVKNERKKWEKKIVDTGDKILDHVFDFENLQKLVENCVSINCAELAMKLGGANLKFIADLRQEKKDRYPIEKELKALKEEQSRLQQNRKNLPKKEEQRLDELTFEDFLLQVQPMHTICDVEKYNAAAQETIFSLMNYVIFYTTQKEEEFEKLSFAPRLVRGRSMSAEEILAESTAGRNKCQEYVSQVVEYAKEYIIDGLHLQNLVTTINSAQDQFNTKDWQLVITLGVHSQELLKDQLMTREVYEALEKKRLELVASAPPGISGPSEEMKSVLDDLEELKPELTYDAPTLRSGILHLANIVIDAARRLPNSDENVNVLCEQAILVFKMTMTKEKFDEVQTLTDPKEWKSVRQDLLDCLKEHDSFLPGSPITLHQQCELLLIEGMWQEAMDILPDPSNDAHLNLQCRQTLELLWFEVERISPSDLNQLLPFIEKYAKKEYQQMNMNTLDRLYDSVQKYFPDFIPKAYEMACEVLASNMTAKQYTIFADVLLQLRQRLVSELNDKKTWDTFIAKVRKEHGRKKKLIQVLNVREVH